MEKREKTRERKSSKSSKSSAPPKDIPPADLPIQMFSILKKVIPEVEKKKTKDNDRRNMIPDIKLCQLSNWSKLRPYMSLDFVSDCSISLPPPISVIPWQSQESILLGEVLSILEGFQGKYIIAQPLTGPYDQRTFIVDDSIEPTLRHLVQQILPLASDYSIVVRFIENKRQLEWGRVNQALSSAMDSHIECYTSFIAQLESQLRKNELTMQMLWYFLQGTFQRFKILARIANNINEHKSIGGMTLSILHKETLHYINDKLSQTLCMELASKAAVPYFDSLQRWLHKGIVFDPYNEFLINDNVSMEADANSVTGLYSDDYWRERYTVVDDENVPSFLIQVKEIILRTGRYLNVIRQCRETSRSSIDFCVPPVEKLVYSLQGEQYLTTIEKAYQFASSSLLDLLLKDYDIVNRIKSLKRYFLMEQGDFIVQLLDLCEEELMKPIQEVIPSRLQSLFELALRTSTGKYDPYKEDVSLTILTQNNTFQILNIQNITGSKEEDKSFMQKNEQFQQFSRTGLEGFAFQVISKWPLSLLFNQKIIGCYQMLFRHLVHCKHVDRRLCRVWITDKAVKQLPTSAAAGYLGAFSLRQRMLFCVQNLEYFMMEEAIEPNWIRFMLKIASVRNVDDLLEEHRAFVSQCMQDCMFMNHDLIAIINNILASCIEFCDFIQTSEGVYSKPVENQSFENNILMLDEKFTSSLISLLTTISNLRLEGVEQKLRNIIYRENFNGFYSDEIEKERINDVGASVSSSG